MSTNSARQLQATEAALLAEEARQANEAMHLTSDNIYLMPPKIIRDIFAHLKTEPEDPCLQQIYFMLGSVWKATDLQDPRTQALLIEIKVVDDRSLEVAKLLCMFARNALEICRLLQLATLKFIVQLDAAKANFLAPAIMCSHGSVCESIPGANITPGAIIVTMRHAPISVLSDMLSRMPRETRINRAVHCTIMKAAVSCEGIGLLELVYEYGLHSNYILHVAARSEKICVDAIEYIMYKMGYDAQLSYFIHEATEANNTRVLDILSMYMFD